MPNDESRERDKPMAMRISGLNSAILCEAVLMMLWMSLYVAWICGHSDIVVPSFFKNVQEMNCARNGDGCVNCAEEREESFGAYFR